MKNSYDDFNRITGIRYNNETTPRYEYAYNANGQVAFVRNNQINHVAESEYDLANRPCRVKTHKVIKDTNGNVTSSEHIYTGEVAYDPAFGRLTKFTERVGNARTEYATEFGYDEENRPTSLAYGTYGQSTITYDGLGRVQKTTTKAGSGSAKTSQYTYVAGAALETSVPSSVTDAERRAAAQNAAGKTSTTGLVASITQTGGNFTYTYDDNGNITKVVQDGITTSYTYDALGQLTQVDDGQENATWVYEYDQGGNIKSKKKYALGVTSGTPVESKSFTYGNANWKDQLTAVDGVTITYDAIGNPLNDGTWQYEWFNGRQLARMYNVDTDASFIYNENGLRVQKTVNGVVTKYTLHGKNIVHMTQGSNELHFFYDAQNKPAVVVYNGTPYSYVKNLQGDIVAILNSAGTAVVNYVYDAWGRPISKTGSMAGTLGTVQPFRYRGYVYDEETDMYYLRNRYYCCDICRFINSDEYYSTSNTLHGNNLFTYCNNNPIILSDTDGQFPFLAAALFIGANTLLGAAGAAFVAWVDGKSGEEIAQAAWEGAATGMAASTIGVIGVATGLGPVSGVLIGAGAGAGAGAAIDIGFQAHEQIESTGSFSWDNVDWARVGETAVTTGLSAAVPVIGSTFSEATYVGGSILLCAEATTVISVGVIIYHKTTDTDSKQIKSIYAD